MITRSLRQTLTKLLLWFSISVWAHAENPSVKVIPAGYELLGAYRVSSITKIKNEKARTIPVKEALYKVFSNGQKILLFHEGLDETHHTYEIYRSDGITTEDNEGNISVTPGIQARNSTANMLKQMSITQQTLTITYFPPLSNAVHVTFAKRVPPPPVKPLK